MTAAIIEEQEKDNEKEHYEFLESDDDFEEFEVQMPDDYCDVEMTGADRHLWVSQQDWDEDEAEDDFQKILRAQLAQTAKF